MLYYNTVMRKVIRTDIYTFEKLIRQDRFYVDKTRYLYELVKNDDENSCYFLCRPRRWGKSLMCSTIDALFEGKKELFDGLYISETDYDFEKYPVIHFDFANLPMESYDYFVEGLQDKIEEQALVLLYYTGYLTFLRGTESTVSLTFPNREIRTSFTCDLIQRYTNNQIVPPTLGKRLKTAAAKEDTEEMMTLLKNYCSQFIYQFFNDDEDGEKKTKRKKLIPESTFQLMLYVLFVAVTMAPGAEEPTSLGRCDIVFFSSDIVCVLELKVDETTEKTLEQIREKGYADRYRLNHNTIHLQGMNFSSRKRQIEDWKEETIHC